MTERTRYRFNRRAVAPALLVELQAAGIPAGLVNPLNGTTEIDLFPEDFDRAATVVAAHDATAIDAAVAQAAQAERADLDARQDSLDQLDTAIARWPSLTPEQKDAALLGCLKGLRLVLRLLLRRMT